MIAKCAICGREFRAKRSTAKYCSQSCKSKAKRGYVFTGEIAPTDVRLSLSDDEVAEVVLHAHDTASDLARASLLTPAPLCRSLGNVSRKLSDALRSEGL